MFKYILHAQAGLDGGRHGWFRWSSGPVPDAKNPTQTISLYDLMLLRVDSAPGTPENEWREAKPCSDRVTRLLAIIMAEEKDPVLLKMVLHLQKKQNYLLDGFTVLYNEEEFVFVPTFIDRYLSSSFFGHLAAMGSILGLRFLQNMFQNNLT